MPIQRSQRLQHGHLLVLKTTPTILLTKQCFDGFFYILLPNKESNTKVIEILFIKIIGLSICPFSAKPVHDKLIPVLQDQLAYPKHARHGPIC